MTPTETVPTPTVAVDRRHLGREEAEAMFVKHSQLLPWLGGTLVAVVLVSASFGVWVLSNARSAAVEPVARVDAKVDILKADTQAQVTALGGKVDQLGQRVGGVEQAVAEQGKKTAAAIEAVQASVGDSKREISQKVDNLTTLLLTGQIVVPKRERDGNHPRPQ